MRRALLLFFAASGFAALVYEIVWLRLAMGAFGVNAPAVSIFLSSFMAGLGLGSWGGGRLAVRLKSPAACLRAYGALELLLAAGALAVPVELRAAQSLLATQAWASASYYALAGALVAAVLLPWCALSGATFPVALAAFDETRGPSAFPALYAANVLGAAAGCGLGVFALIEWLGLAGALRAAAGAGALAGASSVALSFVSSSKRAAKIGGGSSAMIPRGRLALLFLTGFVSMALEVIWTRLYVRFAGNTVYTFANILAFYLLATCAGSLAYRLRLAKPRDSALLAAVGAGALLSLAAADRVWLGHSQSLPWFLAQLALGVVPFSAATGWLTPKLVDDCSAGAPRPAGLAYAVNVAGCIAGPLTAGFVLLPAMSPAWALVCASVPLFGAAFLVEDRKPALAVALSAACAAPAILLAGRAGYPGIVLRDREAEVEAFGAGMEKTLLVNGMGMTMLGPATKTMAHLPLAALPRRPRSALDICFGMGTTFRSLSSWDVDVTAVDLVPSVPSLFSFFHPGAAAGPRARVVIDDGRRFLRRDRGIYDVITIDPPPPVTGAYSAMLYSRDFYGLARARLAPDGVLQQWIPGDLDPAVALAMMRAVADVFPEIRVFRGYQGWGYHVLASARPILVKTAIPESARRDLSEWGGADLKSTLASELPLAALRERLKTAPELTDDRPFNEYFFLRYNFPALARRLRLGRAS